MACYLSHTGKFIEQMLATAFRILIGDAALSPTLTDGGAVGLLEKAGLYYVEENHGFDIVDKDKHPVIRVRTFVQPSYISLYVEPAQLVVKTLEQYQIPVSSREVML